MSTLTPIQSLVDSTHRAILGFLLAVVALVTFGYGASAFSTATATTPLETLLLPALSLLVCLGAVAWIISLFIQGARRA